MAVVYQNPLREVKKPEQIERWVQVAQSLETPDMERRGAISRIRGMLNVQSRLGHRAAVVYLKQVIFECSKKF